MSWKTDNDKQFEIKSSVIKDYFNKKADLVFTEDAAREEEKCLSKYLPHDKQFDVLDLGCGNGRWASVLCERLDYYVGIDFSETFIHQAEQKFSDERIEFHCLPAQEYVIEHKFDIIFVVGLMTYMNDDQIELMASNIEKMLKPEGRIIVRNVTVDENTSSRKVYDRKLNFIEKLLGRKKYQLIRRTPSEEIKLFERFQLLDKGYIYNTGYIYYIFKK